MESAKNKSKEPLFHITKRMNISSGKFACIYLLSLVVAIILAGIFIIIIGGNPFEFYKTVFSCYFTGSANQRGIYIENLISLTIPLVITSLGVAVAFKMKFWNIGAEGQFIIGGICGTLASIAFGDSFGSIPLLLIMILAGAIGAGLYGLIVAVLKVKFGTNETLLTLMLNYVAIYLIQYCQSSIGIFQKTPGNLRAGFVYVNARMPEFELGNATIDISLFIAILLVFVMFIYLKHTKHGYEISVVGDSVNTAKYAGMNVKKIIVRTMFLSAALMGIAGVLKVSGSYANGRLSAEFTNGVGWTAIIVAWLAMLNPYAILVAAIALSLLSNGCNVLGFGATVSDILQGIILFTVLLFDFFTRYKIMFRKFGNSAKEAV